MTTMTMRRLFSRAAATLVLMVLTTASAWATKLYVNITYDGLTESDATVKVTYYEKNPGVGNGYATLTVKHGSRLTLSDYYDVSVAVT